MSKQKWMLWGALALLQAADFLSTRWVLAHGGVELNPAVKILGLGFAKFLVCVFAVLMLLRAERLRGPFMAAAAYALVVTWNFLMMATTVRP